PERLMGFGRTPRETLYATTIWLGLSGLAALNVCDWVTWGEVSVPVIRSTSAAPYARGGGSSCWTNWENVPKGEEGPLPPRPWPQAIIMACARKFSCLSMPNS